MAKLSFTLLVFAGLNYGSRDVNGITRAQGDLY